MADSVPVRVVVSLVLLLLAGPFVVPEALAAPDASHPISLTLPPEPILPGDALTLHSKSRFTPGQLALLDFSVAGKHADVVSIDNDTAVVVVPPFLPAGAQPLQVVRLPSAQSPSEVIFTAFVPIAPIHAKAAGGRADDPFQFGLNFGDPKFLSVGSTVSGWLQTTNIVTKSTASPLSVSGRISSNVGGILTVSLGADTSTGPEKLTLASFDPKTGIFFGTITSTTGTIRVSGTATVTITPIIAVRTPPRVTSVTPNPVRAGEVVTITGSGFSSAQGTSVVTWSGQPAVDILPVSSWSDTQIQARVASFDAGLFPLYVTVGGLPSLPFDLEVIPPCPAVPEFVKRFGDGVQDILRAVQQTRDCGFVAAGSTIPVGRKDPEVLLVRTDPRGNVVFTRTYGGTGIDEAYAVQETADRGYIIAGRTTSPEFGALGSDMLLIKTDPKGVVEWQRLFGAGKDGGLGDEIAYAVQQTTDGGYVVAGVTNSYRISSLDLGSRNVLIVKTNRRGDREWGRIYGTSSDEEARAVRQTADGGYVAAGFVSSGGTGKALVVKTDPYGEQQWMRTYGAGFGLDEFHSVRETPGGNGLVLGGRSRSKAGDLQFLLVRTDAGGTQTLIRTYGSSGGQDEAVSARLVGAGGVLLGGRVTATSVDGLLVRADCSGTQVASRNLGLAGDDVVNAMETTFDGGSILAGSLRDPVTGSVDALLVKLNELAPPTLEIQSFTSDGLEFREVAFNQAVTLAWTVLNSTSMRLERLSGPGPDVDVTVTGGAVVNGTQALQFAVDPTSCLDGCEDTVYRLTAITACDRLEAHVALRTKVPEQVRELLNAADVIVQRFGAGPPVPPDGIWINSHTRAPFDQSACFTGQGKPFVELHVPLTFDLPSVPIDPREPLLVMYDLNDMLVAWAYSRKFDATMKPTGAPVPDDTWFVHEGGWHLGNGAMTVFPGRVDPPDQPYFVGCAFPCFGGPQLQGVPCSPFINGCGASFPPYIMHPALWDVHVFRAPDNGLPKIGIFTSDSTVNLPDPCAGTGLGRTSQNVKFDLGGFVNAPQQLWVPFVP
jgi:hypothetical protein